MQPIFSAIPYHDMLAHWQTLSQRPGTLFFDGQGAHGGRFSYICTDPYQQVQSHDPCMAETAWHTHENTLRAQPHTPHPDLPPFQGGAAGLIGYDYGRHLMALPQHANQTWPALHLNLYDVVLGYDHLSQNAWVIANGLPETTPTARQNRAKARLAAFKDHLAQPIPSIQTIAPQYFELEQLICTTSKNDYGQAVETIRQYILAGDIFQANLSQQFHWPCPTPINTVALYQRMRQQQTPFSAYGNFGTFELLSLSPERFLRVHPKGLVEACPIKGTCARHPDPKQDQMAQDALVHSAKNRSENIMIVDLMRNDLSKVCTPESIDVPHLCAPHRFENVHHLISTITGQLSHDVSLGTLLRATLAAGSITGAPKKRAMTIIDALEPHQRGPYCGHLFWMDGCGQFDSNILIRTLIAQPHQITLHAGGAVVLDSDPIQEYHETWIKAHSILHGLVSNPQALSAWIQKCCASART